MSNFNTAREALEVSLSSEGSAMKEHEKWMQSIEASVNKLKAAWQGLSQAFLKSDFLKGALGTITKLADGLTSLMDTFGTLPTLATLFMGGMSLFNKGGFFKVARDELTGFATGITTTFGQVAKSVNASLSSINIKNGFVETLNQGDIVAIRNYSDAVKSGTATTEDLTACMADAGDAAKSYVQNTDAASVSVDGFVNSQQAAEVSTLAQNKSLGSARVLMREYQGGCKATGMAQQDFANAVKQTNPQLAAAMTSTNSVRAGMVTYTVSLVGAKVATFALQAATIALNMALTMGIGLLVSGLFSALSKRIETAKELAEKVEEVTSKFKEQHKELVKNKSSFESQASRYGQLAKGVNELGENVSLTADEYAEYQDIVNSIADQVPSLIQGYDAQGNAILDYAGNVKQLTAAYEELIKKQNDSVLNSDAYKDTVKDFKNKISDFRGEDSKISTDSVRLLEDALNSGYSREEIEKAFNLPTNTVDIAYLLKDVGLADNVHWYSTHGTYIDAIIDAIENNPEKVREAINNFKSDVDATAEGMRTAAQAALSKAFDLSDSEYKDIGVKTQSLIRQVVGNFDAEQFLKINLSGQTVEEYINGMIDSFKNMSEGESTQLEAAFDLQTKFNGGDISYGKYIQGIKNAEELIDSLNIDDDVKNQIKLTLDTEEIQNEYEALKKRLTSEEYDIQIKDEEAEELLDNLTASEYQVAIDLIDDEDVDFSDFNSIEKLRAYIEKQAKLNDALNYTIAIDVEKESLDALNTAMAESVSGAGLSSEAIAALKSRYAELEGEGYNLSAMFEETANGIHLNREAVSELEQKLASDKLVETDKQLEVLKGRYDELAVEIDNCTDAGKRAALYTEQQSIVDKINDLATLASQYEGLTSAYNAWIATEEAGSERDMYEGIIGGFETVKDEISRGWIDDGTIKFLELLTGKTGLASKSGKELKEIYDSLDDTIKNTTYSVSDFFTVDEDGNSTNTGVYNFLDAIGQLEEEKFGGKDVVKRDKDGNVIGFDFEIVAQKDKNGNVIKNGDQVVAEALGISEELVQIMVRASDDAGFVVNLEGAYTQLANLKTEAESARDTLISLQKNGLEKLKGVDVDFNLDAEGNDLLKEQEEAVKLLDKFKDKNGKIDLTMEGAQQALDIAEYLTIKLDDLTEPKFMRIDTSEVEEDLRDPIEKMQEIGDLCKEKHLVTLTGDTEELKEVQDEIDTIAKELANLEKDEKVKVGIDPEWDSKTIADKIEKGEIEIPAKLELDVQMSDDLKDIRLLMMDNLGLTADGEVELKIKYGIDDSTADKLIQDDKAEIVIEYITKNEKEFNKLTEEEKEVVVNLIANGVDLEKYEAEDKEAIVNYIANGEEADGWTPEAKDAFVKYLADGGEIDKFDPKNKESWVVYKKDSSEPDNYQPDPKTQQVTANLDSSEPDDYQPPSKTMGVWAKFKGWLGEKLGSGSTRNDSNGFGGVNGTANVDGTTGRAFKQGSWGTKNSGSALVGELGAETLVRDGRYYTIGDAGAEFIKYQKGDIIFNHRQTEELFKNGRVTSDGGRARALVNGTAYAGGSIGDGRGLGLRIQSSKDKAVEISTKSVNVSSKTTETKNSSSESNKSSKSSESSGSFGSGDGNKVDGESAMSAAKEKTEEEKKEFEETFDWIEVAIKRVEQEIDKLDKQTNRTYTSWSSRNAALEEEISEVNNAIAVQEEAARVYENAADSVGLDQDWINKIQSGAFDVDTLNQDNISEGELEKIKNYQKWYELYLQCEQAAEDLKDTEAELYKQNFDNVVSKYDGKLDAIENMMSIMEQDIELSKYTNHISSSNNDSYNRLINQEKNTINQLTAKKIELEQALNESIRNGLSTNSEDYQEMRNEIDAITLTIKESTTNISQYYRDMFDEVSEKYDAILQGYEHTESMLDEYISQVEAKGQIVSKNYYQALIDNEKANISQLKKEQSALIKARDNAVKSGNIAKYSQEWYEMSNSIDEVTRAIEESNTALIEHSNSMRDIDWRIFDLTQQRISDITDEAEFLIELMSNEKLFDDKGKLTDQGLATMGLRAQNYNTHMYQADNYGEEAAKIEAQLAKGYDENLEERRRELIELQRESILAAEDEKNAIRDLVEESINEELDALDELIEKKNEALESERDLYEYQKKVKEQTKEIASLEKQMAAYSGDSSEEAKAKIQELKISLEEAKTELQETEYDKYISDQQKLLDSFYLEYETILNSRLDNIDALINDVINMINTGSEATNSTLSALLGTEGSLTTSLGTALGAEGEIVKGIGGNAALIKNTITSEANNVGVKLSSAMNNIWSAGEGSAKSVLTTYGEDFRNKTTTINSTLSGIKVGVDNLVRESNKQATVNVNAGKTQSSTVANPITNKPVAPIVNNTETPKTPKPATPSSSGDDKAKVGDKVKFVNGQYYYDSQGKQPLGYHNRGGYVYITKINTASWATHPIHISTGKKLGNGDLGWLQKWQISGYATGKKRISDNEYAWTQENGQEFIVRPSDGAILTPVAKGDSVLNATATGNIWSMANSPAEFIRDNLKLDASNVPNGSNVQNSYMQNLDKVVFNFPNVKSYDEMLAAMQKDKNFERLLLSMTIDRIAGKSPLAKGKSIR